jgi:hypothetical protein
MVDGAPPDPPPVVAPAPTSQASSAKTVLLKTDVLGFVLLRFGAELEVFLRERDSIALYGFFMAPKDWSYDHFGDYGLPIVMEPYKKFDTSILGGGLDVQYRRYLERGYGPFALYVAPGFVAQHLSLDATESCTPDTECGSQVPHQSFWYLGPSFDIGAQTIVGKRMVVAASVGAHYRFVAGSLDTHTTGTWFPGWQVANGPGFRWRARVEVGWALF